MKSRIRLPLDAGDTPGNPLRSLRMSMLAALRISRAPALAFAGLGIALGIFNAGDLGFLPPRIFGIVSNPTLLAVPLFVFMGVVLEKARIAERLLADLSSLFGQRPGGLAVAVILFEGSLTLKFQEIPGLESVIRNLVTVGVVEAFSEG